MVGQAFHCLRRTLYFISTLKKRTYFSHRLWLEGNIHANNGSLFEGRLSKTSINFRHYINSQSLIKYEMKNNGNSSLLDIILFQCKIHNKEDIYLLFEYLSCFNALLDSL